MGGNARLGGEVGCAKGRCSADAVVSRIDGTVPTEPSSADERGYADVVRTAIAKERRGDRVQRIQRKVAHGRTPGPSSLQRFQTGRKAYDKKSLGRSQRLHNSRSAGERSHGWCAERGCGEGAGTAQGGLIGSGCDFADRQEEQTRIRLGLKENMKHASDVSRRFWARLPLR